LKIGELLLEAKAITKEQLDEALGTQPASGKKLGQILIERGWVGEGQLTQCLSLQLSIPWVSLYHIDFSRQLLNRVPRELADKYCLVPIYVRHVKGQGETLYVAMDDPTNAAALAEVREAANLPARPMIASASDIRSAIRVYYGGGAEDAEPAISSVQQQPPTTKPDAPAMRAAPAKPPKPPISTPPAPPVAPVSPAPPSAPAAVAPPLTAARATSTAPRSAAHARSDAAADSLAEDAPATVVEGRASSPGHDPDAEPVSIDLTRKKGPRMVALTLLDGTTINLPAQKTRPSSMPPPPGSFPDQLTARDLISALRAVAHGADATEILGRDHRLEPILAALLSLLLRKGLIADWEFVEELHKF
jgi:type IV pilus assembly protein PilB